MYRKEGIQRREIGRLNKNLHGLVLKFAPSKVAKKLG
jgi:hypothetical protein